MLTLIHQDPKPLPSFLLDSIEPKFDEIRAVAWIHGDGPWTSFLDRLANAPSQLSYLYRDGPALHADPRRFTAGESLGHKFGVLELLNHHFRPLDDQEIAAMDCCFILRELAYIAMLPNGHNVYVPTPAAAKASAHQRLADPIALEADFPGIFKFQD